MNLGTESLQTEPRSECCSSKSEFDIVAGNNVKIGTSWWNRSFEKSVGPLLINIS